MSENIYVALFIVWYVASTLGGIFNCIAVSTNGEVRIGNLILGIFAFHITIIGLMIFYGKRLLYNKFLNKPLWRLK